MLLRFWVQGYRRFGERVELDFTEKRNYSFGTEAVRGDVLEKVVILGSNGAGKTSFGYALLDITTTLTGFNKDVGQFNDACFLSGYSDSDVATFHYEFGYRGTIVVYEYSKSSHDRIVSERLEVNRKPVFSYDLRNPESDVFNLELICSHPELRPEKDGSVSLLRLIDGSARIDPDSPVGSVLSFAKSSIYYMAMWKVDVHIGFMDEDDRVEEYVIKHGLVEELRSFLREKCGFEYELEVKDGRLVTPSGRVQLPFLETASRGTVILCRLFCWNRRSRDLESLVFFDDFDDLFDHKTAENMMTHIIRDSKAQCVFVTHNPSLLSSDSLRPDCCFILHDGQLRSLASLTDKNIRKGHNLEKMLREGEFDKDVS